MHLNNIMRWVPARQHIFVVLLLSCVVTYFCLSGILNDIWNQTVIVSVNLDGKLQEQVGVRCRIPKLDPFDISIKHLIKYDYATPNCAINFIFTMDFNSTLIQVKKPETLGWTQCCYKVVSRVPANGNSSDPDNAQSFSDECYPIKENRTKIPVTNEFITIYCKPVETQKKYKSNATRPPDPDMIDAFALTPIKPLVEKRIEKFLSESKLTPDSVNLVILGIDSLSHLSFQRLMPKVHATYQNMVAVLTSQNVSEVDAGCGNSTYFDECPFIWKNFSENGYRTCYGEDNPWGGIFNYLKGGFRYPPTDYYLRPLPKVIQEHIKNYPSLTRLPENKPACYGSRLSLQFLLEYMKSMASTMGRDKRYFQFLWSNALTHDYLNTGHLGEPYLLDFLEWFSKQGHLNNTVFVLLSDHGIRFGKIRNFRQGKIEENMPFIYFLFPNWFKTKFKGAIKNLSNNKERLTTPYDTYETFKDILFLDDIDEKNLKGRENYLRWLIRADKIPRGISMFLPIPKSRTCQQCVIPDHYCICHKTEELSTNSSEVKQAANYTLSTLNTLLGKYPKCAHLALHSIQDAQRVLAENMKYGFGKDQVAEVSFITTPGNASFDATVVKNGTGEFKLSGEISRTNRYGNQSYCVDAKELKKYCYCI